jgi:spermidine synthase
MPTRQPKFVTATPCGSSTCRSPLRRAAPPYVVARGETLPHIAGFMMLSLVIACFTLSGFAALLYQTAWLRLFAVAFGTSEIAIAVVLAGYMGGLALGAAVVARYVGQIRRPVLVYGLLEAGVAVTALALPWAVALSGDLFALIVGNQPIPPDAASSGQLLYYSIASFLVLVIPTALMGATLPLLARYAVTSNRNVGTRVSMLYSMNTFGAVGGTLLAGFVLLPSLGLRATVWVGVATNGVIFVIAVLLSRRAAMSSVSREVSPQLTQRPLPGGARFMLAFIALSGFLSFVYEILWTRLLSHVLGSSIYAFSTMLSAFLAGIAIGAAVAGPFARKARRAVPLFAICQFGIALTAAFVYWRLENSFSGQLNAVVLAFITILPSSIFIGATYPLAVRAYTGGVADVGRSSAVVYSWNTVGAIAGALAGGFFIVPMLGFAGAAKLAIVANLLLGIAALAVYAATRQRSPSATLPLGLAVIVTLAVALFYSPGRPDSVITRVLFGGSGEALVREVYYSVGRSSTVLLTENEARFDLSSNGLPEAQIEFKGAPPMVLSQRWLGLWPSLARPDTESILVVGLGGGVVLEGIPASVETVHVVELEAGVVRANELIASRRDADATSDPRVHIAINDARNALRLTAKTYDAIVSQPSHPWTAGASHLFTREFFALVKSRLNEDGVFVQWMNAEFLDEALLARLAATLLAEFKNVRIYEPSALALHFLASDGPIDIGQQVAMTGRPLGDDPLHYARNGINSPFSLANALLLDERGVAQIAAGYKPTTDDDNRMAFDSNVSAQGLGTVQLSRITADIKPRPDTESWSQPVSDDADPEVMPAAEALRFIDQRIATAASLELYGQRAWAGQRLGNQPVFIESVAFFVRTSRDRLWNADYYGEELDPADLQAMTSSLESFAVELRRLMPLDPGGRAAIVLPQLLDLQGVLANY